MATKEETQPLWWLVPVIVLTLLFAKKLGVFDVGEMFVDKEAQRTVQEFERYSQPPQPRGDCP